MTAEPALFVYGTLMPGHLRWPLLELNATGQRPARCRGRLYDTGRGWPAAVFDDGGRGDADDQVPGVLVGLRPDVADAVLAELDVVEGVPDGHYRRVVVTTTEGDQAWAWTPVGTVDAMVRIDAWAPVRER